MTRKHKPHTAHKKRPSAQSGKPARSPASDKALAATASPREKDRRGATAAKKAAGGARPALAHAKVNDSARPADARSSGGKAAADKRPLGIERRVPVMPEDRQSQLKLLIARGKEQGYLTYAQVNDHLPSEIVDPEQIEDIVNTINDMGIPVYEKAPDTESLLATEPSAPADEEAVEEAAAALAALDAELGRTTDPVRMYMREMGTVELLTREGEIEIAKRIEGGLQAMMLAISASPTTIAEILAYADRIGAGEMQISEVVDGFVSEDEADDYVAEEDVDFFDEEDDDDGQGGSKALTKKLEELKAAALAKFANLRINFDKMRKAFEKEGYQSPSYNKAQQAISAELMTIRFTVKTIEKLCAILRSQVDDVRRYERELRKILVDKCGMPQDYFIKHFPPNILNLKWAEREVAAGKQYSVVLARNLPPVQELQKKLSDQ